MPDADEEREVLNLVLAPLSNKLWHILLAAGLSDEQLEQVLEPLADYTAGVYVMAFNRGQAKVLFEATR